MLTPWKKSYDKPRQCVKKQRHYFTSKGLYSQCYDFSMYGCESWTIKKSEWVPKNWCFWTVLLEKILESPLNCKISNQSILEEINPEYSLERLMLNLRFQYFGHLMQRADSLGKILSLGKIEGRRRRGQQRMRWFDDIIDRMDMNLSKLWEIVKYKETWHAAIHGVTKSWTQLSN